MPAKITSRTRWAVGLGAAALLVCFGVFLLAWRSGWWSDDEEESLAGAINSPVAVKQTDQGWVITQVPECFEVGSAPWRLRMRELTPPVPMERAHALITEVPIFTVLKDGTRLPGVYAFNDASVPKVGSARMPECIRFNGRRFLIREWTHVGMVDGNIPPNSHVKMSGDTIPLDWGS